ncbi:NEDD4 family-interacting protein 1 [Microtus ochrogaster]|uniref:NEDD4 family-interacting protein 1 n=1 Tax=Microtus ochrogaster TaxID=79684 RepID=A0A8J6KLT1_MICOH|nr:NEDD4 family-interacting protein 1 [Microtus ochrogaster]
MRTVVPDKPRREEWRVQKTQEMTLQNEEEPGEPEQTAGDAPPPYSSISAENAAYFDYKDESGFPKPPSYNVATTLPSYDEAERTKTEATIPLVPGRDEDFVGRDDFDDADQLRIGKDGIFMLTFFMAFLFNWIGFFLSFCLTTSAAGRYGAISGFGLSLIKWILIVRFSTYFPGYFDGQYWLWWVFLVLADSGEIEIHTSIYDLSCSGNYEAQLCWSPVFGMLPGRRKCPQPHGTVQKNLAKSSYSWALTECPERRRRLSPAPAPFILGAANPLLCVAAREAEMWKG